MHVDGLQQDLQLTPLGVVREGVNVLLQPLTSEGGLGNCLVALLCELTTDVGREPGYLSRTEEAELVETLQLSPLLGLHQLDHSNHLV